MDDCRFVELALFWLVDHNIFDVDELFEELLEILLDDVEMEVAKQALVDVIGLYNLLHCSTCTQNQVSASQVMHQLI